MQAGVESIIPFASFKRLVVECLQETGEDMWIQPGAIKNLREATEAFLVETFRNANAINLAYGHTTLSKKAMRLALLNSQYQPKKK